MIRPVSEIRETIGLWTRSLIAWPDGGQDTTTFAAWLQGPTLFADLRQPPDPPSFSGISCLEDIAPEHCEWLARQEGFAGRFVRAGSAYEWQRMIDFQCPTSASDAGYLRFDGDVLIEEGRDVPYIEHWHLSPSNFTPLFALRMRDKRGTAGFLVRVGELFMYVRPRAEPLPHGAFLPDLVKSAAIKDARAFLDCEISLGRVQGEIWTIERSSLPYRVGADLAPTVTSAHPAFTTQDVTSDGTPFTRAWTVSEFDSASEQETGNTPGNDHGLSSFQPVNGRAS